MTEIRYLAAFDYDKTLVPGFPSIGAFFHQWKLPKDVDIKSDILPKLRGVGMLGVPGLILAQIPNLPFFRPLKESSWIASSIIDKCEEEKNVSIDRMIITGRRMGTHWAISWTTRDIPQFDLFFNPGISSHLYKKRRLYFEMKHNPEAEAKKIKTKTVAAFFNDDWRAVYHIGEINDMFQREGDDSIVYGYVLEGITNKFLSPAIRKELERRHIKFVKSLPAAVLDFTHKIQDESNNTPKGVLKSKRRQAYRSRTSVLV